MSFSYMNFEMVGYSWIEVNECYRRNTVHNLIQMYGINNRGNVKHKYVYLQICDSNLHYLNKSEMVGSLK
jgi:hypothetical protein